MNKAAINYLLSFLAGVAVTFGFVFLSGSLHRGASVRTSPGVDEMIWAFAPIILPLLIISMLGGALLSYYWNDVSAFANGWLPKASRTSSQLAATSATQKLRGNSEVNAVRDELERQLGRLIVLIAGQLEHSKDHVASLRDTNVHLATVTNVSELREVVHALIIKNEKNESQTRDLETRLKEAQDQTASLRVRLSQAEKLASLDPLTSVANRRRFEQFIAAEVARSHENGTPLCLIMTDIDHFKSVNDRHGHSAGDRVLKAFADLLTKSVRGADLVARYGGEEFAVVLPQTPMGDAFGIAERIRSIFALHGGTRDSSVKEFGNLTASFGVAQIRDGEPPSALIQRADQMLYEAKNSGRNRTMIWSSSSESAGS